MSNTDKKNEIRFNNYFKENKYLKLTHTDKGKTDKELAIVKEVTIKTIDDGDWSSDLIDRLILEDFEGEVWNNSEQSLMDIQKRKSMLKKDDRVLVVQQGNKMPKKTNVEFGRPSLRRTYSGDGQVNFGKDKTDFIDKIYRHIKGKFDKHKHVKDYKIIIFKAEITDKKDNKLSFKRDNGYVSEDAKEHDIFFKLDETEDIANITISIPKEKEKYIKEKTIDTENIKRNKEDVTVTIDDKEYKVKSITDHQEKASLDKIKKIIEDMNRPKYQVKWKMKYKLRWYYKTNYSGSKYFPLKIANIKMVSGANKYIQIDKYTVLKEGDIVKYNNPSHKNNGLLAKIVGISEDNRDSRIYYEKQKIYTIKFEPFETYIETSKLKEYKKKYPTIKTTTLANVPHTNILNFRFVEEFYYDEDIEKWVDEPAKPNRTQKGGTGDPLKEAEEAAEEAEKEAEEAKQLKKQNPKTPLKYIEQINDAAKYARKAATNARKAVSAKEAAKEAKEAAAAAKEAKSIKESILSFIKTLAEEKAIEATPPPFASRTVPPPPPVTAKKVTEKEVKEATTAATEKAATAVEATPAATAAEEKAEATVPTNAQAEASSKDKMNDVIAEKTLGILKKNSVFIPDNIFARYQPDPQIRDMNKLVKTDSKNAYIIAHPPKIKKRPNGLYFDYEKTKERSIDLYEISIYVDLTLLQSKAITEEEWNDKTLPEKVGKILFDQVRNSYAGILDCPNRLDKLKTITDNIKKGIWFPDDDMNKSDSNLIEKTVKQKLIKIKDLKDKEKAAIKQKKASKDAKEIQNFDNEIKKIKRKIIELESITNYKGGMRKHKTRKKKKINKYIKVRPRKTKKYKNW
jgi:hypothetical protein